MPATEDAPRAKGAGVVVGKGAGRAAASGGVKAPSRRRHNESSEDEVADSEAEGRRGGRSRPRRHRDGDRGETQRDTPVVWQWLDDLLTGFAEIHKVAVTNGHSCAECTRRSAYVGKQRIVEAVDGVSSALSPTQEQRTGRGQAAPVTFQHE